MGADRFARPAWPARATSSGSGGDKPSAKNSNDKQVDGCADSDTASKRDEPGHSGLSQLSEHALTTQPFEDEAQEHLCYEVRDIPMSMDSPLTR